MLDKLGTASFAIILGLFFVLASPIIGLMVIWCFVSMAFNKLKKK